MIKDAGPAGAIQKVAPSVGSAVKTGIAVGGSQAGRYVAIQFSNGETHQIHAEDVDKALQQNPGAKVAQ